MFKIRVRPPFIFQYFESSFGCSSSGWAPFLLGALLMFGPNQAVFYILQLDEYFYIILFVNGLHMLGTILDYLPLLRSFYGDTHSSQERQNLQLGQNPQWVPGPQPGILTGGIQIAPPPPPPSPPVTKTIIYFISLFFLIYSITFECYKT